MLRSSKYVFVGLLMTAMFVVMPSRAEAQIGIKGGFLYSTLKFEETDDVFEGRNGWIAGLFFGSGPDNVVGFQSEINILEKGGKTAANDELKLYYLQNAWLLRVGGGGRVNVYGIVGPALEFKVAEKGQDDVAFISDYNGIDIGLVGGLGVEIGKLVLEGRGNWGLRNVAISTGGLENQKLTSRSFALQVGVRF